MPTLDPTARFWAKVKRTDLCWLWTAALNSNGYGSFWDGSRVGAAHRFAYELLVGPIPDGLQIDHLCRNRRCVNPDHMEVVTSGTNTLRGESFAGVHARQTHCKRGHPLSGYNLVLVRNGRSCRICRLMLNRESAARHPRGPH